MVRFNIRRRYIGLVRYLYFCIDVIVINLNYFICYVGILNIISVIDFGKIIFKIVNNVWKIF